MELANRLHFANLIFNFSHLQINTNNHCPERVYIAKTPTASYQIITASGDYDGMLIGSIDEIFREDEEDDLIRYFHWHTGEEEQ